MIMPPSTIAFDVARGAGSILRYLDVFEPWWEAGMLFACDGVIAVAAPQEAPEHWEPGAGIHFYNRLIPARRLPEVLPMFGIEKLRLVTEPLPIPDVKPWEPCPCRECSLHAPDIYCQDCETGWLPVWEPITVRSGPFPIRFKTHHLGRIRGWGAEKLNVMPGPQGMTNAAYFRCGTLLGCVMPMTPEES